jgi:hypothetical protein
MQWRSSQDGDPAQIPPQRSTLRLYAPPRGHDVEGGSGPDAEGRRAAQPVTVNPTITSTIRGAIEICIRPLIVPADT